MYANLKNYVPSEIKYVVSDEVKEVLPVELDFAGVKKTLKSPADVMNFVGKEFNATFPSNEIAMRELDDFEVGNIREEYCLLQEEVVPQRKAELEQALETAKMMKKRAEEAYEAIVLEIEKYAAEVKSGTREMILPSRETFCIAVGGYYAMYTFCKEKGTFVLAKAFEIPDRSELWANEERNRKALSAIFGIDVPETPQPEAVGADDEMPFGD